jgi:hypothetical protein
MDFLGCRAGRDVEVLWRLAEDQVADAAADDERLESGILEFLDGLAGVGTQFLEPDAMLGPRYGDELVNGDLRLCRLNTADALV